MSSSDPSMVESGVLMASLERDLMMARAHSHSREFIQTKAYLSEALITVMELLRREANKSRQ